MTRLLASAAVIAAGLAAMNLSLAEQPAGELKPVAAFDSIQNDTRRSLALFRETGKVLQHPRCVNCHPEGDSPLQGMAMHAHQPPVTRGPGNFGAPGMRCTTCHGRDNTRVVAQAEDLKSVPGMTGWHLAPMSMAWEGKSLGEICRQLKDRERNGDMDMAELVEHMSHDDLVGWGWEPGAGREPVPGTQARFGKLVQAWVDSGAHCPG